jgi:hypothetical protein
MLFSFRVEVVESGFFNGMCILQTVMGISKNSNFGLRARHAKKITAGIWLIFRGLFFEHNAAIRLKGNF